MPGWVDFCKIRVEAYTKHRTKSVNRNTIVGKNTENGNTQYVCVRYREIRQQKLIQNKNTLYIKMCLKALFIQVLKRTDKSTDRYFNAHK